MTAKQKHAMQRRAERKMKGMVWRGWISSDDEWIGGWRFTLAHKPSDRQDLAAYADHAPFRWKITAMAICEAKDAHGKVKVYTDGCEREIGQALLKDELISEAREAMREATENTNPNHITERVYLLEPIV